MRSFLAFALHRSGELSLFAIALVGVPVLAQQPVGPSEAQSAFTVSVVVQPSCVFDVTPHQTGGASVAVQCQSGDLAHARIRVQNEALSGQNREIGLPPSSPVSGARATIRTDVRGGSVLQIDF